MCAGLRPDGFGLAPLVASLSRQRRWQSALDLSREAHQAAVARNVFLASTCINAAGGKSWQLAIQVLEEVGFWRLRVDAHVFASGMSSCCAKVQWIQAVALLLQQLYRALQPTSVARNVLAAVLRWREATRLVDYEEPMPDQILSLVSSLSSSNCWRRSLPLLPSSSEGNGSKELAASNAIANCCVQSSQWREALRIIAECHEVDAIGFNIAICADGSNVCWQRATGTLQTMSLKRIDATLASHNALLAQHAAAEEWQQGLRLLGTEVDALSFSSSMSACQRALQWSKVLTLLRSMGRAAQRCDLVCLNCAVAAASWRRAVTMGSAEGRFILDEITYSETLTLCASAKQWLVAEVLLAQMPLEALADLSRFYDGNIKRKTYLTSNDMDIW